MRLKLLVATVVSIAVGCFVPCVVGFAGTVKVLGSLARVSIALFGVFGVWLGLSYRDEIVTGLWRDNSDVKMQRLKANLIEASGISVGLRAPDSGVKRCEHGARSAECLQRAV